MRHGQIPLVVLLLVLAACSVSRTQKSEGAAETSADLSAAPSAVMSAQPPLSSTQRVVDPRDVRGRNPCELFTSGQLAEVGLLAASAKDTTTVSRAPTCGWERADDRANVASVQVRTDFTIPVLESLDLVKESFVTFEATEVASYPARRADRTPMTGCSLVVAIADYQGIVTNGDFAGRDPDPCARSRRMAEMILSNLPPLR
jgi:hypothetical protein